MERVRAALSSGLDMRATATPVLRIVIACNNGLMLNRFGIRRYHCCAAPSQTIHVHAVYQENVLLTRWPLELTCTWFSV